MTLRRLVLGTLLAAFPGSHAPPWAVDLVSEGLAGHVLFGSNIVDSTQLAALTASLRAARADLDDCDLRGDVPIGDVLIGIDEEGGDVTRLWHREGSPYPGNAALGAIDDPAVTREIYREIGMDLARLGINLNLAPAVDVNSTAENPVIGTRSFGSSASLVSRHAAAAVSGLQSTGVAACAKHFPGHGATTTDSHLALPLVDVPLSVLRSRDLPPFSAAIEAGVVAVMTAHIRLPALTGELPATFSAPALELLRSLGFDGVIVTDALEMRGAAVTASAAVTARGVGGLGPAAVAALAAGADLLCLGATVSAELVEDVVAAVEAAIADGRLGLGRVEEAASRVRHLAAWTRAHSSAGTTGSPAASSLGDASASRLGLEAARRAVRIDGTVPDLSDALVVQLESERTIAEGRVPWGILPHVDAGRRSSSMRVVAASVRTEEVLAAAGGRPIVFAARGVHRLVGAMPLIESVAMAAPVVVVEMGWPSTRRPSGVRAFVMTYGASRANARAAAEALHLAA